MEGAGSYFERRGKDAFEATRATESPWDARLQHGGPPTALLARITTDFLGPIPRALVEIRTRVVRPGKRIELLEATMSSSGRDVVTARAWRIVVQPAGSIPPGVTPPDRVPARPAQDESPRWLRGWGWRFATVPAMCCRWPR